VEAGLVDGHKLYLDASLVAANASRNSVIEVVVRREVPSVMRALSVSPSLGKISRERRYPCLRFQGRGTSGITIG
jgi:hypothetical protein